MRRRTILFVPALLVASIAGAVAPAHAVTPPALPDGYENFTPEVDYASLMGDAVTGSTNMSCTIGSSNIAAFPQGSAFNPAEIQNDFVKGLAFVGAMGDSSKEAEASCTVAVSIPKGVRSTTGTVDNPAVQQWLGSGAGQFSLDCDIESSFSATATVRFGGQVPGKFDVVVSGADKPIPFNCSLAVSFGDNTLNGSVKGAVEVVNPTSVGLCDGTLTITCAPVKLTDAVVTITSSTGKFGGLTGTGTYSFSDSFSLKFIETQMATIPGVSISKASVRSAAVRKSSGAAESMNLQLSNKKKSSTAILRPVGTTISLNEGIFVAGTAKASCTLSAKVGAKTAKIASFKLSASGRSTARSFSSKTAKAIGAKKNKSVTLTASCKGTDKKTSTVSRKVTYLG